jgi:adenine-specific DNA-methyltransferase
MIKEEKKNIKINNNIDILKKYFPQCFDKNGNFNIEKFQKEISKNEINLSKESYGLDWLGKSYARVRTFDPARTLLKENEEWNEKEENKNSQNLLIKGDNLEVLKHLSNSYDEKIKMIYIDPPYNTGKDFVYNDDKKFTIEEFMELAGVDEEKAKRVLEFVDSKSNSHSAWLTFMYPRLYIARKLLKDDGVIFVSIDDNEVAQLRLLMDEVFGEENFVGQISVINNLKGRSDDKFFATCNEYLLVYAKNINELKIKGIELTPEEIEEDYKFEDEFGKYKLTNLRKTGKNWEREKRPFLYYPVLEKDGKFYSITKDEYNQIFNKENKKFNDDFVDELIKKYEKLGFQVFLPLDSKGNKGNWRWGFETYNKEKDKNITLNSNNAPSVKMRPVLEDGSIRSKLTKTTWYKGEYDTGSSGKYLKKLFNNKTLFESPKSLFFIKDILKIATSKNDIILDFFAGSGTTGDAVMQLNVEDGGNRKFILVQLPELIDPKKNKTAYDFVKNELKIETPTIFDITKKRLIRAGKKIKENLTNQNVDTSFKIFETTPLWDDYLVDEKELTNQTKLFEVNKLTDEDLKALLTTWKSYDGLPLTQNYQEIKLDDYIAYYCGNILYFMNDDFKTENIKTLLEKIDNDKDFVIDKIVIFGYNFDSVILREIEENIKNYSNKKSIEIEIIIRF